MLQVLQGPRSPIVPSYLQGTLLSDLSVLCLLEMLGSRDQITRGRKGSGSDTEGAPTLLNHNKPPETKKNNCHTVVFVSGDTSESSKVYTSSLQLKPVLIRSHVCEQEASCDAVRGKQEVGDSVLADPDLWTLLEQLPLRELWWTINTHTHTHAD